MTEKEVTASTGEIAMAAKTRGLGTGRGDLGFPTNENGGRETKISAADSSIEVEASNVGPGRAGPGRAGARIHRP
ncbi:hypothetical protein ACWKSP_37465, partial [Micromonosporaceae bacterium Da 78-11]